MAVSPTVGFQDWLTSVCVHYTTLKDDERNATLDCLISLSTAKQLNFLHSKLEDLVYRDFLKLLPHELKEYLLLFLNPRTLLTCSCVSHTWNQIILSSSKVWQKACLSIGLKINTDYCPNDGYYWKKFYLEMARRYRHMLTSQCFETKKYDKHLRRVTAVYYRDGKLATASDSKIVQLWDCHGDKCLLTVRTGVSIAAIKFDDEAIVVASYLGHLVSWDIQNGQQLVEYLRHTAAVFTCDFTRHLDILVSGSADTKIKLWSLNRGQLLTTLQGHSLWVLKVMLKCFYPEHDKSVEPDYLLFSMDKATVIVWQLSCKQRTDCGLQGLYITSLYTIPVCDNNTNFFTPGLHFDGTNLYFVRQQPDLNNQAVLCSFNIQSRRIVSEVNIRMKVKLLLGVGKKYAGILMPRKNSNVPNVVFFDKYTLESVAHCHLPQSRPSTPDCSQISLGDEDWLNGLDGQNDRGILLAAGLIDHSVCIMKWIARNTVL